MSLIIGSVGVEIVPSARGFREKVTALLANMEATVKVKPDVDDKAAKAELDVLTRERKVKVKADTDQSSFAAASRSLSGLSGGIGGIAAAGLTLGPALLPVAAGLTVAFAGLAGPILAAGAGLGAFAVFAVPAITAVVKASTDMAKAQDAVDNATTASQRKGALLKQRQLMADLSPATVTAAKSLDTFKATFAGFQKALAPSVFAVFNAGLGAATALLPALAGIAKAVAPTLVELANSLAAGFKSEGFKSFVAFIAVNAGPAIKLFAGIIGGFAAGLGKLAMDLAPIGTQVLRGLSGLTAGFANMTSSKGFQSFVAYAVANLPLVGKALGDLVKAVGGLLVALAPVGPLALRILDGLLSVVANLATRAPVLGLALAGIGVALGVIGGPAGAVVAALIAAGLAFKAVYDRSAPLRAVLASIGGVFSDLATKVIPVFRGIFNQAVIAVRLAIAALSQVIAANRPQIDQLTNAFRALATFVLTRIVPLLGPILKVVILALGSLIGIVITAVGLLVHAFDIARAPIVAAFNVVAAAGKFMWENVLRPAFKAIVDTFLAVAGAIVHGAATAFGWVPGIGGKLKAAAKTFDTFRDSVNAALAGVHDKTVTVTGKAIIASNSQVYAAQGAKNFAYLNKAQGGPIPLVPGAQRGKDSVPILAMPGEFVIREAVARENHGLLAALNAGTLPRYATGGLIPGGRTSGATQPALLAQGVLNSLESGVGDALKRGLAAAIAAAAAAGAYGVGGSVAGPLGVEAVARARQYLGVPYLWGGMSPGGFDCCLVGASRVYGPHGAIPIRDVRPGDAVYSHVDGRLEAHVVTAAWQSKRQPVFSVRTGSRTVTGSANHPFLRMVKTRNRYFPAGSKRVGAVPAEFGVEWARLDQLRRGDWLVQPRALPTDSKPDPVLPDGTPVDADVAWLVGALVGDGSVTGKGARLCMYGDNRDRARQIITKRWGSHPTYGLTYGLVVSSVRLRDALTEMGMRRPGPEKRMPATVWDWSEDLQRAFLAGYCDADGYRPADQRRHGERTYSSASVDLLADVRALHVSLGDKVSNTSTNHRKKPIIIGGKLVKAALPLHTFTVWTGLHRGEARIRTHGKRLAEWLDDGDFTLATVLEVRAQGDADTWDLEVEGAHNFVADGIVVHNSGLVDYIYSSLGHPLPRTASAMQAGLTPVPLGSAAIGDLLFFGGAAGRGGAHHVGFNLGGGMMLDAPTTGSFVRTESLRGWPDLSSAARPYANGGIIPEPVYGVGKSGRAYTFAERGPELVIPNGGTVKGTEQHFYFKDTTLDRGQLVAVQRQVDLTERIGRPR